MAALGVLETLSTRKLNPLTGIAKTEAEDDATTVVVCLIEAAEDMSKMAMKVSVCPMVAGDRHCSGKSAGWVGWGI